MKKQLNLIIMTLLAVVTLVSCSDSVTYADMKKKERNAINRYISNQKIQKISEAKFEEQGFTTDTTKNEYVLFESNGVYMQIVDRGGKEDKNGVEVINEVDTFANNNVICTRYVEQDMMTGDTTCFNVPLERWMDVPDYYKFPLTFRYVQNTSTVYGIVLSGSLDYDLLWNSKGYGTAIPSGWLIALPYLRNNAHVRLIVPSKMGHTTAQQYVNPYFYDIWKFEKAKS